MANSTLLALINDTLVPDSWEVYCIQSLNDNGFDWTSGLVDYNGNAVSSLTNLTWGITIATCYQFCKANHIPYAWNFQFNDFAASMTNYLFPWLALTAQLPFETGNVFSNLMSFCMALGSPALITYSLTITILNQYWAQARFRTLRDDAGDERVARRFRGIAERIRAALYLLREAQQVPLRASQVGGWLASLIVLPKNAVWWERLKMRLQATRRGVTASLVAQMLFAVTAYLFTVIAAFKAQMGDPETALQIASGSLWIWLIPVISGWLTVGTQSTHHSIEDALKQDQAERGRTPPFLTAPNGSLTESAIQKGLFVLNDESSGLPPQPSQNGTAVGDFTAPGVGHTKRLTWNGCNVGGDEQLKGPIYNYARLFTWCQLASTLHRTFTIAVNKVDRGIACGSLDQYVAGQAPPAWDEQLQNQDENLVSDSFGTGRYCGFDLDENAIRAYPYWTGDEEHNGLSAAVYKRIIGAAFAALFVQWGTTGASVLIAYKTPTVGIGCRSASYLLYGGLGTACWLFLLVSMLLSHAAMLAYQEVHIQHPSIDLRKRQRGPGLWLLCALAVTTRYIGKTLAVVNTIWLILSSLLEFVGALNNCWCKGDALGLHSKGWVVLFKNSTDLAIAAQDIWGGAFAMTVGVCIASYFLFALTLIKDEDD
ncbi:hypothetical protein BAUCODRAFT_568559 [Baudoinia panamericana UAMH 10762]|uniref:Uncharacterized protein n=1 Tax=Baudoinia panamericana (strain UAMH 10762) TaxID=717646 RepID=M2N4I7_BAUPA|nr:uncharacterized protein BAUCODRAFT_568559 [Baudoinia panamericana UAMH 10762]EMC93630.1 hypothetical protein BAUCODRAFT_568559 [Baudoinia panamericana UAMH 10762]